MARGEESVTPQIDAGLGLIYRLNFLWAEADRIALSGDFDKWNFVLDRIYVNLLYRNPIQVKYAVEDKTYVEELKLEEKDVAIHEKFARLLKEISKRIVKAIREKNRREYNLLKEEKYNLLLTKDAWLRKAMQERKLYLKESNFNPANAMWGG